MKFWIDLWSKQKYLPTSRHRVLRERYVKNGVDVEVKEPTEQEFPVAFIVNDYKFVYENAKSYDDFNGNSDYKMFHEEIRTYGGKLYMPVRITHGAAISTCFESLEYIKHELTDYMPYWEGEEKFSDLSKAA